MKRVVITNKTRGQRAVITGANITLVKAVKLLSYFATRKGWDVKADKFGVKLLTPKTASI